MSKIVFVEKNNAFTLPIPRNGFTINETNQEFSDKIFTGWTYPVEFFMTPELIRIYGDPSNTNIVSRKRKDWGFISLEGTVYPACLKLVSCFNQKLKLQLEFGYESLEVFEKKLSELPLEKIPLGFDNGYQFDSVSKKFPEVNINFPAIEVKRWNSDEKKYKRKGVFNYYAGTGYGSTYDPEDDEVYSLKPFVYLFHILQAGFATENLILAGDILNDPELRYAMLNHTNIPFYKKEYIAEKEAKVLLKPDPAKFYSGIKYLVTEQITITDNIIGEYYFSVLEDGNKIVAFTAVLKATDYQGTVTTHTLNLSESATAGQVDVQKLIPEFVTYADIVITLSVTIQYEGLGNDVARSFSVFLIPQGTSPGYNYQWKTLDVNAVDYVPDVTFGTLINSIKKARKFKVIISGNKVYFQNTAVNYDAAKNLEFSQSVSKEVLPNEREAFILKLISPEEYEYQQYKIDTEHILTEFEETDNTEIIEIESYPLPIALNATATDDVITAIELVEENSAICLIRYEGLQSGFNRCLSMNTFLVPYIYGTYYTDWIQNRLRSVPMQWKFYTDNLQIRDLTTNDCIYAEGAYHAIIDMTKKFIGENAYEVDLKTENRF